MPSNNKPVVAQESPDVMGIVSIILALAGLSAVGLVVGLIGAHTAKKQGRSPVLSRVGWIINLVFVVLISLFVIILIVSGVFAARQTNRNTVRKQNMMSVHANLEAYHAKYQYYPGNLSALQDFNNLPNDYSSYTYTPAPTGCTQCASYDLRTSLEPGGPNDIYDLRSLTN